MLVGTNLTNNGEFHMQLLMFIRVSRENAGNFITKLASETSIVKEFKLLTYKLHVLAVLLSYLKLKLPTLETIYVFP